MKKDYRMKNHSKKIHASNYKIYPMGYPMGYPVDKNDISTHEYEQYCKYLMSYDVSNYKDPIIIDKKNKIMETFPYDSSIYSNMETEEYLKNKAFIKGINYEILDTINYVFFKNKNDKTEFEDFKNLKEWQRKTVYDAEDELGKHYSRIVFIKNNKLNASINIMPLKDKWNDMIDTIIGFYILNNYNLPESAANFLDNMFFINKEKNYFTILLRDKNEASQLILKLSEIAEVIS
jgi:hypothetical protein